MSPNEQTTTLQEVKSPAPGEDLGGKAAERRSLPRVSLSSEQFRLAANGKVFAVADVSLEGMALRLLSVEDRVLFPVGMAIEGSLKLGPRRHRIQAVVRNLRGDHVGCEFVKLESEVRQELVRRLDPADLGQTLRPMPTPVGLADGPLDWLWFHGHCGTELLARPAEQGKLKRLILVLWGTQFVEWCAHSGLNTGVVRFADSQSSAQGVFRLASEWFESDATLDPAKLHLAETLLKHANLPDGWKAWTASFRE